MHPIEELKSEHEGINLGLRILARFTDNMEAGKEINLEDLAQLVEFFKTFADRCHHSKEEEILFPALQKAGIPKDGGPIGVMLMDHEQGRNYIREMESALDILREGDPSAVSQFIAAARQYVELMSEHIEKENGVLFVLAEKHLPKQQQVKISDDFERIEQERIGPGAHEQFHELLSRLHDEYLLVSSKT